MNILTIQKLWLFFFFLRIYAESTLQTGLIFCSNTFRKNNSNVIYPWQKPGKPCRTCLDSLCRLCKASPATIRCTGDIRGTAATGWNNELLTLLQHSGRADYCALLAEILNRKAVTAFALQVHSHNIFVIIGHGHPLIPQCMVYQQPTSKCSAIQG